MVIGRGWSVLVNLTPEEAGRNWPHLADSWQRRSTGSIYLRQAGSAGAEGGIDNDDCRMESAVDDRRAGLRGYVIGAQDLAVGFNITADLRELSAATNRVVIVDASWTHIVSFPDQEQIAQAFEDACRDASGRVHYVTNLPWDAELFTATAAGFEHLDARVVAIDGHGKDVLPQVRSRLSDFGRKDTVLIGLTPGRDDRGAFQQLRSDIAARTTRVWAFPSHPLSSGPGPSREEALEMVGMWLPAEVLIAAGPISEQILLARYLSENTGASVIRVAAAGGEYRLPGLELIHQRNVERPVEDPSARRLAAARAGLVLVRIVGDESVRLAGVGLTEETAQALEHLRVTGKSRSGEKVIRDIQSAFSSRGLTPPEVRLVG